MKTYLKTKPVWMQLLLFLGITAAMFTILTIIGTLVLAATTGIKISELQNVDKWNSTDPRMINFIRGMLVLQFLGLFLIPSLLFAFFSDPKPISYLGLKAPRREIYWILGLAAIFVAIPAVEYLGLLNQKINLGTSTQTWMKNMEEDAAKQIRFMLAKHTPTELLLNLVFISLFAGIGEEIFFRGVLQRMMIRAFGNPWMGIVMTAAIFSAFHFQFFGFFPRLVLGMVLGAIYWYSGSLWTAILAHFLYDAFIIVLAYIKPSIVQSTDQSIIHSNGLAFWGMISAILTFFVIWLMKKYSATTYAAVYAKDRQSELDKLSF
jgi:membrane protease YdiL (CAAX protease family)